MNAILVTLAVESELAPWRRLRRFRRVRFRNSCIYELPIMSTEVVVMLTGVGALQAGLVRPLATEYRPRAGIVAGVAAGLRPEWRPGDILAAESVCNPRESESAWSDRRLVECAMQCGAKGVRRFVSVKGIIRTAEGKSRLAQTGEAADMESLAVMQLFIREGIPAAAIRAIADTNEQNLPCDFEAALDARGQIRLWRLLVQMLHQPRSLGSLFRFGLASRRATVSLALYLDRFVERLAAGESTHCSRLAAKTR